MNKVTTNDNMIDAYVDLIAEASDLLAQLSEYVEDHGGVAPDDVNETHVTRMTRILRDLNDVKRQAI